MANKSDTATWASVKAELQKLERGPLVSLLQDIYRLSAENRRFLHARMLGAHTEFEKYRELVVDAVFPDPFNQRPVRIKEAERLIRHYRRATNDTEGAADLMLSFVEAGTEQAVDYGYGEGAYFATLQRVLEGVAAALPELAPDSRRKAVARIQEIAACADSIGWGYGDHVREIAAAVEEAQ